MGKAGEEGEEVCKEEPTVRSQEEAEIQVCIQKEELFKVTASGLNFDVVSIWYVGEVTGRMGSKGSSCHFLSIVIGGVHDSLEDVIGDETHGIEWKDSTCLHTGQNESENYVEESVQDSALSSKNQKIRLKLAKRKEKLERLKKKDPKFEEFLSNHAKDLDSLLKKEMYSDEDEASNEDREFADGDDISPSDQRRLVTASMINSWSETTIQKHSLTSLPSLLNAYRAACEYGAKSSGAYGSVVSPRLQDSNTFVSIIMFMLRESDSIFRTHLDMLSNKSKTETVSQMESTPKWKALEPMVKSYLRSTVYLLNQLADTEILFYALNRLRASIIFFAAFPSLLRKLIQVYVLCIEYMEVK
ncbi:hypothetical protein Dimus_021171 [Dionaea muscipula]